MQRTPDSSAASSLQPPPRRGELPPLAAGARIANAHGVPGTLGSLAVTLHDGALVILSSHHVLFGANARESQPVWLVDDDASRPLRVGRSLYGKVGTVTCDGVKQYVDCAVAAVDDAFSLVSTWHIEPRDDEVAVIEQDASVTKTGAATGSTSGVVVDTVRTETAVIDGRLRETPRQIVVRPANGVAFSAKGDSGAILRDDRGRMVGLLWGTNASGESLACHIAPVLRVLGIRPVRVVPTTSSPL